MKKETSPVSSLIPYVLIAFGFSWFFWLLDILNSQNWIRLPFSYMIFFVIGAHGPLVAALILTAREGGWPAVKGLLASGFQLRMKLALWLLGILLPFIIGGISLWVTHSLNAFPFDDSLLRQPWMILPTLLIMFFLGGSVQEEFGWRGYALPRLLRRWNPAAASLILGLIWGMWHLPLFFISGTGQSYMSFAWFLLLAFDFTFLITWFYLRSGRNLFVALWVHAGINTAISVFPPILMQSGSSQTGMMVLVVGYAVLVLGLLVLDRPLWFRKA